MQTGNPAGARQRLLAHNLPTPASEPTHPLKSAWPLALRRFLSNFVDVGTRGTSTPNPFFGGEFSQPALLFGITSKLDIQTVNFIGRQEMSRKPIIHKTPIAATIAAAKATIHTSVFDALPDSAFIRESQLVQSPKRPDHPAPLPFSAPTLWRKVKAGTFPKPIKLSERVTCWKVSEVRAWMTAQALA